MRLSQRFRPKSRSAVVAAFAVGLLIVGLLSAVVVAAFAVNSARQSAAARDDALQAVREAEEKRMRSEVAKEDALHETDEAVRLARKVEVAANRTDRLEYGRHILAAYRHWTAGNVKQAAESLDRCRWNFC